VFVRDVKTGNVATKPLDQLVKSGSWRVEKADETHAYSLVFMVAHEDKPVSSAAVTMKVGDDERQTLVTPTDNGLAGFFVVPFGDVEVTVEYKSDGEDRSLRPQTFEAKPGMAESGPITISITDDVATVEPPAKEEEGDKAADSKSGEKDKEEKGKPATTNPFMTFFNMLIGLAVIGGIAYAVWRYVKANPDQTADTLQKAGVVVPGDGGGTVATMPKKAGPPPQILLGDSAPEPVAPAAVSGAAAVKNPRLVKADGSLYIVQEGEQTVGRENAALTLSGESSVSRSHAKVTRTGDAVMVEDAGSTNGTFVNGQRVGGPQALRPGDTVQFGAVQYRYEE
jgi:hypothetical protein